MIILQNLELKHQIIVLVEITECRVAPQGAEFTRGESKTIGFNPILNIYNNILNDCPGVFLTIMEDCLVPKAPNAIQNRLD